MRSSVLPAAMALLTGCTNVDSTSLDRFSADGRVIALSGAEAGAANACVTCHGLNGRGNGAGTPRLAGLDDGYMERQLEAYADGRRYQKQMSWIAKQLSAEEITQYVASGECDDKAGAYAIQGRAARFVTELRGSYSGVMGLPLYETSQLLEKLRDRRNPY